MIVEADITRRITEPTVADILRGHAKAQPNALAFIGMGSGALSYHALQQHIASIGKDLSRADIGAGDWVAVVLPDGAGLAQMMVALACHATAVPASPHLPASEFDDLFANDRLTAVMVADPTGIAAEIARKHGLRLLITAPSESGIRLSLEQPIGRPHTDSRAITLDDAAFILRTSGTTARPKLVAVTHRNLIATAKAIQEWFDLTSADRALCALPFYYAVALKVGLFTTLITGGSVVCAAPTADADLLDWIGTLAPSWYSASPTLHRSILERARAWEGKTFQHSLRFIHSGAAPLPDGVHDGLETFFGVPVLPTYGLSEAGLIAANTIAPEGRKRGTVGKRLPDALACRDEDGRILPPDELGEIVVRGPTVTPGYVDDREANQAAFVDGWFRTGDLGRIDNDGFVTIVGRLKELINRGGEKIAPSEVDEALLRHPAVAEAAAFAVAHPSLGEDVAAAVVLRPGKAATALELRQFLRTLLAPYKIPRRIHMLDALPRNGTGKVLRSDLSQNLCRLPITRPSVLWASSLEVEIAEIWRRLLKVEDIKRDDEFFDIGGDSLLEAQMLLELEKLTGRTLPEGVLFESATVPQLAESIVQSDTTPAQSLLVKVQPGADRPPFIFVDGDFWGGGYYTRKIAKLLGPEYPFYDLRSHGLRGERVPAIETMAQDYAQLVRSVQPHGPYRLGGHCNGALTALALASKLEAEGERVEFIALIEPITLNARPSLRIIARALDAVLNLTTSDAARREKLLGTAMSFVWRAIRKVNAPHRDREDALPVGDDLDALTLRIRKFDTLAADRYARLQEQYRQIMARHLPAQIASDLLCIIAQSHRNDVAFAGHVCRRLAAHCEIAVIPGEHMTCITTYAEAMTSLIRQRLVALDTPQSPASRQTAAAANS